MTIILIYLSAGLVTGLLSGLFGIGGGILMVPVLLFVFAIQGVADTVAIHVAIASSLGAIVFTAVSSVRAHWNRGNVLLPVFLSLGASMAVGAFVGGRLTGYLPAGILQNIFGVFALSIAARMLIGGNPRPHSTLPGRPALAGVGLVIGAMSSLVGVGGGAMTVPLLAWFGVEMRRAVGTSAACGLPIAVAGALGFMLGGIGRDLPLPPYSTGFVHWPSVLGLAVTSVLSAPLGAALASRLPQATLRRAFGVFLLCMGSYLILT